MGGDDLVFRRNFVHDNTGQGFFIKDGLVRRARIEDNVFVRNQLHGKSPAGFPSAGFQIAIYETTGLRLLRNTVWDNDLNVALGGNVRDAVVRGNLFEDMVADTDAGGGRPGVRQDYNLIAGGWNWGARGRHDIRRRPRFVAPARLDYRLAPGSAGIDAGAADPGSRRDKACRAPYDDPRARNRGGGSSSFADVGALERSPRRLGARDAPAPRLLAARSRARLEAERGALDQPPGGEGQPVGDRERDEEQRDRRELAVSGPREQDRLLHGEREQVQAVGDVAVAGQALRAGRQRYATTRTM